MEQNFGRYRIMSELGRGGMGRVYRAHDPQLRRDVALKVLLRSNFTGEQEVERFDREARVMARLHHPNVVEIYDIGMENGQPFFAMELVETQSLKEYLQEKRTMPGRQAAGLMEKVARAMHVAHCNGVVHRDLKPANILLERKGTADLVPKVADFGLARVGDDSARLTCPGTVVGTPLYMSPEQTVPGDIDERSDVYSLGVILYELLAGRPPFSGRNLEELYEEVRGKIPAPPSSVKSQIPKDLEIICLKALEKDAADRYQSAHLLAEDLSRFQRGEEILARPQGKIRRIWHYLRRRPYLIGAACLLVLLGAAGIILGVYVQEKESRLRTQKIVDEVRRFLQESPVGAFTAASHDTRGIEERRALHDLLEKYWQQEAKLVAASASAEQQEALFEVQKRIGLLALADGNYLLGEMAFERCREIMPSTSYDRNAAGPADEIGELLNMAKNAGTAVLEKRRSRLREIMNTLDAGPPLQGMFDEYVTEILRMRSPEIVEELLPHVEAENYWRRMTAITALGKIGDRLTCRDGLDVGQWLIRRLARIRDVVQGDIARGKRVIDRELGDEATALIWALGRLKDHRANATANDIRYDFGQKSMLWLWTQVPYRWLPCDEGLVPATAREWNNLGQMKYQKGDMEGAIACYRKSAAMDPETASPLNNLANILMDLGRFAEAAEKLGEAIRLDPKNVNLYHNRGCCYRDSGDTEKALADFDRALQLDPEFSDTYTSRAGLYKVMGLKSRAIADFRKVIELRPSDALGYTHLGIVYSQDGRLEEALDAHGKAIEIDPTLAIAYNNRAEVWLKLKKIQEAIADCDRAIALEPRLSKAYNNRGLAFSAAGCDDKAVADFTLAIRFDRGYADAYNNRGLQHIRNGRLEEARGDFDTCLEIQPNFASASVNRSAVYRKSGDVANALADLDAVIRRDGERHEDFTPQTLRSAYINRGVLRYEKNDFAGAESDFTRAIELDPQETAGYLYRGYSRRNQGRHKAAVEDFSVYLRLFPQAPELKKLQDYIRSHR